MKLGPRWGFYSRRAIWIIIIWVSISLVIFLFEYITLLENDAIPADYDLKSRLTAQLLVSLTASLIGGTFTVNLMEYWLRRYAFWKALLFIFLAFTAVGLIAGTLGSIFLKSRQLGVSMWDPSVYDGIMWIYSSSIYIKNYIIWLSIVLITLVFLMVNDRFGPGVFRDYLKGKYFHPKNESRIFMFADIRNATGIAEELGEERYFGLLKQFFRDITSALVETRGEVYQYVGDEVVITWKPKKGKQNANALRCFYRMKNLLHARAERYKERFGVVPDFKVGYHCGEVMVGELGVIKRDIAFSGDVLNTAARIQAQCNALDVDILASATFVDLMGDLPDELKAISLGNFPLKGKKEEVALFTFRNDN